MSAHKNWLGRGISHAKFARFFGNPQSLRRLAGFDWRTSVPVGGIDAHEPVDAPHFAGEPAYCGIACIAAPQIENCHVSLHKHNNIVD